jgi:hypothetical protein
MEQSQQDKRATRRFALQLPISVKYQNGVAGEKNAVTKDVSARGICFYMDSALGEGSLIEFTLTLPPEITLTESIRVRCKGKVVRSEPGNNGTQLRIAAVINEYEFLSAAHDSTS